MLARPARTIALEPFFMEFIAGAELELASHSIALTIQLVRDVEDEIAVYRRWWGERRVDGVLMVDLRVDDPRVDELTRLGLPAVIVGGPLKNHSIPAVWHDEQRVVVEAVEYLAALGHTRVAHGPGKRELGETLAPSPGDLVQCPDLLDRFLRYQVRREGRRPARSATCRDPVKVLVAQHALSER